jgi:hypothetical protein
VEEWDAKGDSYETLAICRTLAIARAAFNVANLRQSRRLLHDPAADARGEAGSKFKVSLFEQYGTCPARPKFHI